MIIIGAGLFIFFGLKRFIQEKILFNKIKKEYFSKNKNTFFLYSSSKKWENYFEEKLIPQIQDKAIIINWSTRHTDNWNGHPIAKEIFSLYRPRPYLYPSAIIFHPNGSVSKFSFYLPYIKMLKSGRKDYEVLEKIFLEMIK